MSDFRKLEDGIFASPQIDVTDIARAKELGVTLAYPGYREGLAALAAAGEGR